jgi:hypothetical protein
MTTVMPARGHSTAPKFSADQPRELRRFFKELEYLFTACAVKDDEEKKGYAVRYLEYDLADLWGLLAEYSTGSYDNFKLAVHELYPGSGEDRKWTLADMDKLVGEQLRVGIFSLADFGNYHRAFIQVTKFLVDKKRLSAGEQSRSFIRGIQPALWERIRYRLEIKKPDVCLDDPYDLKDIVKAAEHVLYDPNIATYVRPSPASSSPGPSTSTSPVKQEDLASTLQVFVQALEKTFEKVMSVQPQPTYRPSAPRPNNQAPGTLDPSCFMCSEIGHGAKECEVTKEMIRLGKCIINADGKIVLPNGHYIPRAIPGKNLRERINEWHTRNPGNGTTSSSSLMYDVSHVQDVPSTIFLGGTSATDIQLTQAEQIQLLERQIMALRSGKKFEGVEILHRQPARAKQPLPVVPVEQLPDQVPAPPAAPSHPQPQSTTQPNITNPPASPSTPQPTAEKSTQAPTTTSKTTTPPQAPRVDNITNAPTHPFASKRANYLPPQEKNFATPQKSDPAYKTTAPIQSAKTIEEVYNRSMAAPCVTLSPNELFSISAEVRQKVREAVTPKRQANADAAAVNMSEVQPVLPFAMVEDIEETLISSNVQDPPVDGIIIPDVYETYLSRLAPGEIPDVLTVARESHSLRSISLNVNNTADVESILDAGCSIVAMSEATCHAIGVVYDPSIVINMQSANGEMDLTLGLARNVPCRVGEITLYLQFHIVRSPAYDILLSRPFDVLTESLVKNYANEDQTITICDPNFNRKITVPTFRRGPPKYTTVTKPRQDFQTSQQ